MKKEEVTTLSNNFYAVKSINCYNVYFHAFLMNLVYYLLFNVFINYCMMELSSMDNTELMDLLAKYTSDYTRMMSEGTSNEEYEKCNMTIKAIQAEIELRKGNGSTTITPPPDFIV